MSLSLSIGGASLGASALASLKLDVGGFFEVIIVWLGKNFDPFFDGCTAVIEWVLGGIEWILVTPHWAIMIAVLVLIAWRATGWRLALFAGIGLLLIVQMGQWKASMQTLALIGTSVIIALMIAIPIGIWSSKNDLVESIVRPILDFMQTLPAFVYLIPAVLFFQLGKVPGVVATLIFAMPPAVRLTNLGIRQVPKDIKEAAISFGSTPSQTLFKAELPVALPTILAGMNQTIMLALSMVVIAGLIGAGGLGNQVVKGITQLKIGLGFESGIAIVILAIYLDRVTQALGTATQRN